MAHFETSLVRGPLFILEQARRLGVDSDELLREADLRPEQVADPDARIPISKLAVFWRALIHHLPARDLGVRLGASFDILKSGLVGYLVLNSRDLGGALEQVVRFSRILNEAVRPRLEVAADRAVLSWAPSPFFRPYPQASDWGIAALLTCLRQATRTDLEPLEVRFCYPRPATVPAAHRSHFGRRVRFDQARAGLVLSRRLLALPIPGADTELGTYLERHAELVLGGLSASGGLQARVRRRLWEQLREGRPSVRRIAASLGTSPRSLQRGLRAEGISFATLRDEMLRALAKSLLHDQDLTIDEISVLLGYSEPATFYRAFRRWERTSPALYRLAG